MENGVFNSERKSPDKYELVLTSKKISQADVEARKQRDKEAEEKARGVNPNPKF